MISELQRPERIEFTAYSWTEINYDSLFSGDTTRLFDPALSGKRVYQRYAKSTRFAVDGLYESVERIFSALTVDGNTLEFVELKSSQGRTFIITKEDYEQLKAK